MPRLQLLGGFALRNDAGSNLALASRKDAALLAYLALQPRPVERSAAASLLWHDRSEEQARKSLRQALVSLRRVLNLERDIVPSDRGEQISLALEHLWVDAVEFERAATSRNFGRAADMYRGSLLEGFAEPAGGFGDWLEIERTRFADLAFGVLADLAEQHLQAKDWEAALSVAQRAVAVQPLRESGHRLVMRALNGTGRRNEALQQFQRLSVLLHQELDVRPDPETGALYQAIKSSADAPIILAAATPARIVTDSRPGLVVLPLRVTQDGRADDDLADALTEELIATLAAYRWFFVTSALQASVYRGRKVEPKELAAELGVRYVVSGSAQRHGNQLSMRLSLIETARGEHLWSDRRRCYLDELLQAQDALARDVAAVLEPELLRAESEAALRTPLTDVTRWSQLAQARRLADNGQEEQACRLASEIAKRFPDCAYSQATLGWASWMKFKLRDSSPKTLEQGLQASILAIQIDPRLFLGHSAKGACLASRSADDLEDAVNNLRKAVDLNPSFPVAYNQLVSALTHAGRPREAIGWIEPLDEISPNDPFRGYYRCVRGLTWFFLKDDQAAIVNAEDSLAMHPGWFLSELVLAAASQRAGDLRRATEAGHRLREAHGTLSPAQLRGVIRLKRETDFSEILGRLTDVGFVTAGD